MKQQCGAWIAVGRRDVKERTKSDEETNEAVYTRILTVIHSGQLAPGQRLPEPVVARVLGVSRERVRRALHRLAHEGWLELVPNKGACLLEISEYNLIQIFEARRVLEGAVVRMLAERPNVVMLEGIAEHLAAECHAAHRQDRPRQIALSGEFHQKLFELAGNPWLLGFFRQVIAPTVLAYAIYAPKQLPHCGGPLEHEAIVDAIRRGDGNTAETLMRAHLDEAMGHIRSFRRPDVERSVEDTFAAFGPLDGSEADAACSNCTPE